jgi:tellurite resistance protein
MLQGLELLSTEERREVIRLIGIEEEVDPEVAPTAVLTWMCGLVGLKSGPDPALLERSVLEAVADHWEVEHSPEIDTDDLERLLRRKMASEATVLLGPCWRLACALLAAEASAVDDSKLDLLEKAARIVVPSTSVLGEHRREWEKLVNTWQHENPVPHLKEELDALAQVPGVARQALRLGLVIALADGRLSADEERLCKELGIAMGLPEAESFPGELNSLFWKHRNAMAELAASRPEEVGVVAARQALVESGALEGLANEARDNLVGEEEEEVESSGWSRMMGALSGLSQFFSARMDDESQASLSRIVYLTIMKQRGVVLRQQREQERAAKKEQERAAKTSQAAFRPVAQEAPVNTPAPPPPPTPAPAPQKIEQKRSISLD